MGKGVEGTFQNRRRFERKKVSIAAYIGDPRWQRHDFVAGTMLDISLGGIKLSIPRETSVETQDLTETDELSIIFSIPTCLWPISMKISPQRICESVDEVQLGASLINLSSPAYSALQKYLN